MTEYRIDKRAADKLRKFMEAESDRGMILLVIAAIDEMAQGRLRCELSKGSKEALARLLDPPMGYLGGFMAKIDMLYVMGVINQRIHSDIQKINRLRNKCAHLMHEFVFDKEIYDKYIQDIFGDGTLATMAWYRESSDWKIKSREALVITVLIMEFVLVPDSRDGHADAKCVAR